MKLDKDYGKALLNRFNLLFEDEKYLEAKEDFDRLKTVSPALFEEVGHLEPTVNIRAEEAKKKLADETMGKLKDVGNQFLGMFGLSTDNFKMNPTDGGGYNISFQQ